jgi:hypothetical protein
MTMESQLQVVPAVLQVPVRYMQVARVAQESWVAQMMQVVVVVVPEAPQPTDLRVPQLDRQAPVHQAVPVAW